VPYARGDAPLPVGYDDFAALCRRRRSVRWYRDQPVERELVDRALDAALQSPSACNRQSFQFRFFDEPDRVAKLAGIPAGTKGYGDSLPAICAVVGRLRAYPEERDRHVIYIDGALAAMSFMLALETVGLSSCAINWPDIAAQDEAAAKLLGLDPDERVVMLIGLGHADPQGKIPYSAKKPLASMRRWN
jgi:nitroreductase